MPDKFQVCLVGIACSSHDVLLAPYCLQAAIMSSDALAKMADVQVDHYSHVLAQEFDGRCADIAASVIKAAPDLVGFSVYCWNRAAVERVSQLVRSTLPDVPIVWGGPEISAGDILSGKYADAPVDVLVVGEGEIPFKRLVEHFCFDSSMTIARLAYRQGAAFIGHNLGDPMADTLPELYGYPSPYLRVPPALLQSPDVWAIVESQRGCNFKCSYCQYHQNFPVIRWRDVGDVLDEIDYIWQGGCRRLRFADGNFISAKRRAIVILYDMADRGIKMELLFEAIPSFIDDDVAYAIERYREFSGLPVTVGIGLQTMRPDTGRAIKRKIPIAKFDNAFRLLNLAGATIKTDIILGLPLETLESYYQMLEYVAEKLRDGKNCLTISVLRVLPGSEMERIAEQYGLVIEDVPERFVYETPTMPRADMIECLRMSSVAHRLFSSMTMRDEYYRRRDELGLSHVEMLRRIALRTASSFPSGDFPNAEHWWTFSASEIITDDSMAKVIKWGGRDRTC